MCLSSNADYLRQLRRALKVTYPMAKGQDFPDASTRSMMGLSSLNIAGSLADQGDGDLPHSDDDDDDIFDKDDFSAASLNIDPHLPTAFEPLRLHSTSNINETRLAHDMSEEELLSSSMVISITVLCCLFFCYLYSCDRAPKLPEI